MVEEPLDLIAVPVEAGTEPDKPISILHLSTDISVYVLTRILASTSEFGF